MKTISKTGNFMNKSAPYYKYWGKADGEDPNRYHLLPYHCLDVAAVGKMLLESHYLLRTRLAMSLKIGEDKLIQLCCFFLAIHDIGKFAEVFQNKRADLREHLYGQDAGRQSKIRHDNLGYIVWKDLWERFIGTASFGFDSEHDLIWELKDNFNRLVCCSTGHHGYPSRADDGRQVLNADSYYSDIDMDSVFKFCVAQWKMHVHCDSVLINRLGDEDAVAKCSWWISGILVVCDWVGSDDSIFEYLDELMELEGYWRLRALPNASKALSRCGFLPSKPSRPMNLVQLSGEQINPTPLQQLCSQSNNFEEPQLWILEDITGSGKTEAAMLLVNRMMAAGQADGFYIGLPTMATADGMYRRMANYYQKLFKDDQVPSLILAHGSRHLSDDFRKSIVNIPSSQKSYGNEEITGAAQCTAWLADNRKKALLADVGVGTVDQSLLSILPSRHQCMRLFGLGSKLLLVDEVHAHDTYVNELLKKLLTFHAYIGGSAILLSATLPRKMRNELVRAYQRGRGKHGGLVEETDAYPLATIVKNQRTENIPVQASRRSIRSVPVKLIHEEEAAIDELKIKSSKSQCACWIRNTVWDAIQAYRLLLEDKAVDPSKIMLFHARYTLGDRLRIENRVIKAFGKKSTAKDREGRILISSQVIENSLDLCLDGMVSDLAPIDSMIQRAGRLHRHRRDARGDPLVEIDAVDQRRSPKLYILSPDVVESPDAKWYADFLPKAAFVYPHVGRLWLTARILKAKKEINMPFHLRELIEGVYAEAFEKIPENLIEASKEAEADAMGMASLGKYNGLEFERGYDFRSGEWSEEINVPTRLGEETNTVYLARLDNDRLVPLKEGNFPWDLSSLRLSKRKLEKISVKTQEKYHDHLEKLIQSEKRLKNNDLIIPVKELGDRKWTSEGINGKGLLVEIRYDENLGLMVGDEIRGG
jgi:CRISPR-associated endonuclease/helicase Cas3